MRALLRILHLFIVLGLFAPPSTQAPALGSQEGESQWRSAQVERIALAHEQQADARATSALEERGERRTATEGGDGDAREHACAAAPDRRSTKSSRSFELGYAQARLALAHLRVNGSANAAGARA